MSGSSADAGSQHWAHQSSQSTDLSSRASETIVSNQQNEGGNSNVAGAAPGVLGVGGGCTDTPSVSESSSSSLSRSSSSSQYLPSSSQSSSTPSFSPSSLNRSSHSGHCQNATTDRYYHHMSGTGCCGAQEGRVHNRHALVRNDSHGTHSVVGSSSGGGCGGGLPESWRSDSGLSFGSCAHTLHHSRACGGGGGSGRQGRSAAHSVTTTEVIHPLSTQSSTNLTGSVASQVLKLLCKQNSGKKSVIWEDGTVDNEAMNKKSSKSCCIYHKPRQFGESSDESSGGDN